MKRRRLIFLLNTTRTLVLRRADQGLAELGLTSTQLGALFVVTSGEGCLMRELAESLYLAPPAITGLVGRMEKQGLIERRRCTRDGRAFRIHSTESGRALQKRAIPLLIALNASLEGDFSPEELDVVERFLRTAIDRLSDDQPSTDGGPDRDTPR